MMCHVNSTNIKAIGKKIIDHVGAALTWKYKLKINAKGIIKKNDNTDIVHHWCGIRAADNRIRVWNFHNDRTAVHTSLLR